MTPQSPQISVSRTAEPVTFQVDVRARTNTRHTVTVRSNYLVELGVATQSQERILQGAFAFLLERESNTSILTRFDLEDIERFFPEFRADIVRRVAPPV